MRKRTFIIAEAGVNHNGDLSMAKELVNVAADAGADFVKFQTFNPDKLVTRSLGKADYQKQSTDKTESQHAMLSRLELTDLMHRELIAHCATCNIGFLSTAFDIESVNFLANLGLNYFKIPSGEITNLPYLRNIGKLRKNVLMSTGMASLGEIEAAINVLTKSGTPREKITVLHCTSEYPTPMNEVNLRAMISIQKAFNVAVGYSDHTAGIEIACAAVVMGANVIEKHLTLDRKLPGPDHSASLEPSELKEMVANIRNIEIALGDGIKRVTKSEAKNKEIVRKSLVATRSIALGEKFTIENIGIKRPGSGISPMKYYEVIGKRAPREFLVDELIEL